MHLRLPKAFLLLCGLFALVPAASSQALEFPPPGGKGPVVVVASGQHGATSFDDLARDIAELGYDVILIDGNDVLNSQGQALRDAIKEGQSSPHALPGKVGVVGYSMGGAGALTWAAQWNDVVAIVVAWYPATSRIANPADYARTIRTPVLMFAGEADTYKNCCLIDKAREIAAAARAAGAPLELITYPGVQHGFAQRWGNYDPQAASDSFKRAKAKLARYLRR